jgi:subtilisin family serine protease
VADKGFSSQEDMRASFSNYGRCLDIFAPGTYDYQPPKN